MLLRDLINKIEERIPRQYAMDWDNVGLLVGDRDSSVSKVLVCLDVTAEEIDTAIDMGADLIISHHPMIFSSVRTVNTDDVLGSKIYQAIRAGVAIYAMHTNYDCVKMGYLAADVMELSSVEILDRCFEGDETHGIGVIGCFNEAKSLRGIAALVKESFDLVNVKVFASEEELENSYSRIAISPGSGKSEIGNALRSGVEVLITGDIDHHSGIDARADGLIIIDAGHFGLEHIFIEDIVDTLSEISKDLDVAKSATRPIIDI